MAEKVFNPVPEKEGFFANIEKFWTGRSNRIIAHITHADDADGLGCELIDKFIDLPADMKIYNYRSHIDDLPLIIETVNKEVHPDAFIITDIGVSVNAVKELLETEMPVYWYDHHQVSDTTWKAIDRMKDEVHKPLIHFNIYNESYRVNNFKYAFMNSSVMKHYEMKLSASYIYLYFMQNHMIHTDNDILRRLFSIVNFISMGDTYSMTNLNVNRFAVDMTTEHLGNDIIYMQDENEIVTDFPAIIFKKFKGEFFLKEFSSYIVSGAINNIRMAIHSLLEIRKFEMSIFENTCYKLTYGYENYIVAPYAFSEFSYCANKMLQKLEKDGSNYAVAEIWSDIREGKPTYKISMRSIESFPGYTPTNCYEICKNLFHGGGHPNAAGGTLTPEQFSYFMNPCGDDPCNPENSASRSTHPIVCIDLIEKLLHVSDEDEVERSKIIDDYAHAATYSYFKHSYLSTSGSKIVGTDIYIRGDEYGFPYYTGHVKINLLTNCIEAEYDAHNCPVEVRDGIYE